MKYIKTTLIILALLGIVFIFGGYKENFDLNNKKINRLFRDSFIEKNDSSDDEDNTDIGKKLFNRHVRIQKRRQKQIQNRENN